MSRIAQIADMIRAGKSRREIVASLPNLSKSAVKTYIANAENLVTGAIRRERQHRPGTRQVTIRSVAPGCSTDGDTARTMSITMPSPPWESQP